MAQLRHRRDHRAGQVDVLFIGLHQAQMNLGSSTVATGSLQDECGNQEQAGADHVHPALHASKARKGREARIPQNADPLIDGDQSQQAGENLVQTVALAPG